jgi:tight adherence protein C
MLLFVSALMGCAIGGIAFVLVDLVVRQRSFDPRLGRFEVDRRNAIREKSTTYRLFEPWVDDWVPWFERNYDETKLEPVKKHLAASGSELPWVPVEFLAIRRIEAIFSAALAYFFFWVLLGLSTAFLTVPIVFFGFEFLSRRLLRSNAIRRQIQIKRRFAAAIDLMALMMEVGAGFQESLNVAVEESKGSPLGAELSLVKRDMTMGKREDALRNFVTRTQDEDIAEVVFAIIEGEELGTPLAKILRIQAEQMRQKRSQWAEKASAEAEVTLVFPAMLIMIACLLLVVAPFILTAIFNP